MKYNVLIIVLILFFAVVCTARGGDKVNGAKVALFNCSNQDYYALNHTNEKGEFAFFDIPSGYYYLIIRIPKNILSVNLENREILRNLTDGGCNRSEGQMIFKIKDNCFSYNINCEDLTSSKFTPCLEITEEKDEYYVSIAYVEITETVTINGIFKNISIRSFKQNLESGRYSLCNEDDFIR